MTAADLLTPLLGGALIGLASAMLLLGPGRIAGATGILATVITARPEPWKLAFLAGLVGTGAVAAVVWPGSFATTHAPGPALTVAAGLLVGFGTREANGCTSGHGVCGNARLAPRSLVATITFIAAGMVTVAVVGLVGGGA